MWASVVSVHGLSNCSSWALEHRLNSCGTQVQLLCGMWDLPGSGIKLVSPALASSLPLSYHGSSYTLHFKSIFHCQIIFVNSIRSAFIFIFKNRLYFREAGVGFQNYAGSA